MVHLFGCGRIVGDLDGHCSRCHRYLGLYCEWSQDWNSIRSDMKHGLSVYNFLPQQEDSGSPTIGIVLLVFKGGLGFILNIVAFGIMIRAFVVLNARNDKSRKAKKVSDVILKSSFSFNKMYSYIIANATKKYFLMGCELRNWDYTVKTKAYKFTRIKTVVFIWTQI